MFLCNSLAPDLEDILNTCMDEDKAFPIVWLHLMDLIVSLSIDKFEMIKEHIKKPSSQSVQG